MVNSGIPSRACQTCKDRRIKCDATWPVCTNCTRLGRECAGVPDSFEIVHRNQTKKVILLRSRQSKNWCTTTRAKRINSTAKCIKSSSSPSEDNDHPRQSPTAQWHLYNRDKSSSDGFELSNADLSTPLQDVAIAHYFSHFVPPPRPSYRRGNFFEWVQPMFTSTRPTSPLHHITCALALVTLSDHQRRPDLRVKALLLYGQALATHRLALSDPQKVKSDEMLMTCMLFTIFETMSPTSKSLQGRKTHVNGMVSLLRLRGTAQIEQNRSHRLFMGARMQLIFSRMGTAEPIGPFVDDADWYFDSATSFNPWDTLGTISLRIPSLRARSKRLFEASSPTIEEFRLLLQDAEAIDGELVRWFQELPVTWRLKSIPCFGSIPEDLDNAVVWPGLVYIYTEAFANHVVNNYRVCRIYVQEILVQCLKRLAPAEFHNPLAAELDQCRFTLQMVVDDICASLPCYLNGDVVAELYPALKQRTRQLEPFRAYQLLWPMAAAKNVRSIPWQQREWLKGRLRAMDKEYGFRVALDLIDQPARRE